MNAEQHAEQHAEQQPQSPHVSEDAVTGPTKMSRREALAIVGKHAVYTAPAVLAVLAATKSNKVYADISIP